MAARIELAGRPIIITGGGSGIGAATASACAKAGMPVLIAGRRAEPLQRTAASIESTGGTCATLTVDVTDTGHEDELLAAADASIGPPWAVFANAGRGLDRPAHATDDDEMRSLFDVNFFATHRLLRAAAGRLMEQGTGGHLLACASCVSKFSPPYHGAYAATKAAMDLYCQAMRLELAPVGIHVSTIHPITTVTDFFDVSAEISGRPHTQSGIDHTPKFLQQSPERVASAIVRCLRRPTPEVWTSRLVRATAAVRGLFPRVMDRQMRAMLESERLREHDSPDTTP